MGSLSEGVEVGNILDPPSSPSSDGMKASADGENLGDVKPSPVPAFEKYPLDPDTVRKLHVEAESS